MGFLDIGGPVSGGILVCELMIWIPMSGNTKTRCKCQETRHLDPEYSSFHFISHYPNITSI